MEQDNKIKSKVEDEVSWRGEDSLQGSNKENNLKEALKERKDVEQNLTWDLTAIYKNEEAFQQAIEKVTSLTIEIEEKFKGKLNTAHYINQCLSRLQEVNSSISCLVSYAYLQLSVDQGNSQNQNMYTMVMGVVSNLRSKLTFIKSEILEVQEDIVEEAIKESQENKNYLKDIIDSKPYELHPQAEKVLSALTSVLDAPYQIYNTTKLTDIDFGHFTVDGEEYPLSFVLFENKWEVEKNTKLRRRAFQVFSSKLREYQNTMAATYQAKLQTEKTIANLRGYPTVIDSLLHKQKVDTKLFDRQIDLIMEKLAPHMRRYAKLLQKIHGLEEMTFADLKLSIDPSYDPIISIEDSKEHILMALSPLGDDYLTMVTKSFDERWIDFVCNKGKQTGAFCSTPYGTHPYILISWTDKMRDVFILAHEIGHAGHFNLTNQNQNVFNSNPSVYFVEAPSTMNELLVAHYLIETNRNLRFKRWVLASLVSRTYYHNFVTHLLEATFQREVYKIIDEGGSLQASKLNEIKKGVLEKFWGDTVIINEGAELTWMRQPHYYMGLYPYTYSAGLTIATEVSKRILKNRDRGINDWLKVLKAGGSKNPKELAKMAGVDITTEKPLVETINYIGEMIEEIERLTETLEK